MGSSLEGSVSSDGNLITLEKDGGASMQGYFYFHFGWFPLPKWRLGRDNLILLCSPLLLVSRLSIQLFFSFFSINDKHPRKRIPQPRLQHIHGQGNGENFSESRLRFRLAQLFFLLVFLLSSLKNGHFCRRPLNQESRQKERRFLNNKGTFYDNRNGSENEPKSVILKIGVILKGCGLPRSSIEQSTFPRPEKTRNTRRLF